MKLARTTVRILTGRQLSRMAAAYDPGAFPTLSDTPDCSSSFTHGDTAKCN